MHSPCCRCLTPPHWASFSKPLLSLKHGIVKFAMEQIQGPKLSISPAQASAVMTLFVGSPSPGSQVLARLEVRWSCQL